MQSSILIGFDDYLDTEISGLCEEYYGHPQPDPSQLYIWDSGFRNYCHQAWQDTCDAYDDARLY